MGEQLFSIVAKKGLVSQEGKEGWLRRWEGVCQQGQEQNSAVIEGMDKDESGNWRKGLLARKDIDLKK